MEQAREAADNADPDRVPDPGAGPEPAAVRMVTLTLLADRDYLALARTSAMHVASLLFFPLPRVNDLRLAVDEACTSFLQPADGPAADADGAAPGPQDTMTLRYDRFPQSLHVTLSAPVPRGWPQRDELGWELLSSLVGDVQVSVRDGVGTVRLIVALPTAAGD
jgi:serine/threonine-protein kinase RsbW